MADTSSFVTVVSGLPRSGTSLMMQMLAAGGIAPLKDDKRRPDEDNPCGYYELEAVRRLRNDCAWVSASRGKAVKVIYRLLADLPMDVPYCVIFMLRDLDEVIASQQTMLGRRRQTGAQVTPETLRSLYTAQLSETLAWARKQPNIALLQVNYREAVLDPACVARTVNEFLGGSLDEEAMAAVANPSLYRHRQ